MKIKQFFDNKKVQLSILIVCVAVFTFNFGLLVYRCYGYVQAQGEYNDLYADVMHSSSRDREAVTETENGMEPTEDDSEYHVPDFSVDFEELLQINPDCIGYLYIPAIDLSYPIVQSADNVDYLDTTFTGTKNAAGCIFNDATIVAPFYQRTILYGHNMKDGSMFAKLYNLNINDDVWVYLPNGSIRHYTIMEFKDTTVSDTSVYTVSGSADDLVLSTCIKNKDRHVVILKRDGTFL